MAQPAGSGIQQANQVSTLIGSQYAHGIVMLRARPRWIQGSDCDVPDDASRRWMPDLRMTWSVEQEAACSGQSAATCTTQRDGDAQMILIKLMNALPAGIGRTGDLCVQAATRIRHAALEVRSFMQLPKVFADRN